MLSGPDCSSHWTPHTHTSFGLASGRSGIGSLPLAQCFLPVKSAGLGVTARPSSARRLGSTAPGFPSCLRADSWALECRDVTVTSLELKLCTHEKKTVLVILYLSPPLFFVFLLLFPFVFLSLSLCVAYFSYVCVCAWYSVVILFISLCVWGLGEECE